MILGFVRDTLSNLRSGARLALFARIDRHDFRVDAAQLVMMVIVSALVDNAADYLRQPPGAVLDWAAIGAELASFAVLVAIAALLAWAFSDAALVVALPVIVLASLPLVQIANVAPLYLERVESVPDWLDDSVYYIVLTWFIAVLWRSTFTALQPTTGRLARSIGGAFLLSLPLFLPAGVLPEASWWRESGTSAVLDVANPASEPVIALQRELQDEALGALVDHTPGETELYFVAFAGDGASGASRPRVEQARRTMDANWATEGRSLVYVNDVATLTEAPMATVSNLRGALEEIGGAIDAGEDIVMLYLAGRGRADGSLVVSMPPLGLVQLTGPGLAHLLTRAGIRWRVVIVAACNGGDFVDALADENSLILATPTGMRECVNGDAPAALHNALFDEALAGATSLTAAVQSAHRKLEQGGHASRLHVGEAMASQLQKLRGVRGNRAQRASPSLA